MKRTVRGALSVAALPATLAAVITVMPSAQGQAPVAARLPHRHEARDTSGPMTWVETTYARAVLTQLNLSRARAGLRPMRWNPRLVCSSLRHDRNMARADELTHQLPHELPFDKREARCGYHQNGAAENAGVNGAVSLAGALQLEKMMIDERPPGETGHRRNILGPYRDVGIAVYFDHRHHKLWLTEDFGTPR